MRHLGSPWQHADRSCFSRISRPLSVGRTLWIAFFAAAAGRLQVVGSSLLTAAIEQNRSVAFKDCMRRSGGGGDEALSSLLKSTSRQCRKGLKSFYCQRVADVPVVRESAPMEQFCGRSGESAASQKAAFQLEPVQNARVAFFVLAFGYPENVGRLISKIVQFAFHVLVHVDIKRPAYLRQLTDWVGAQGLEAKVNVTSEYRVNRGGVSTLKAWLGGMMWLLEHVNNWDYFVNLNDSDYPIARLDSLGRFLWLNRGSNFVNVGSAYKDCDCGRYLVYECGDELYSIAPELRYPRRPELQHASGPNLVAVTRDFAQYIASNRNVSGSPVKQVLDDLSILQQPDEKFFQTISVNSPYCRRHVRWGFHIWDRPGLSQDASTPEVAGPELKMLTPPLLSATFWPKLQDVKRTRLAVFFARKFDNKQTANIQDDVDAALSGDTADFSMDAGSWNQLEARAAEWLGALSRVVLGDAVGQQLDSLQVWQQSPVDGVYFAVSRFRARVRLPCASPPVRTTQTALAFNSVTDVFGSSSEGAIPVVALRSSGSPAQRGCRAVGWALLEELGARAPPAGPAESERSSALPSIGALRVGVDWSQELLTFLGPVSILPAGNLGKVMAVIYWTIAAARAFEEIGEYQELEVQWTSPHGKSGVERATLAPNSLVSWAAMPSSLPSQAGNWSVEVWLAGILQGSRTFHACSGSCSKLHAEAVTQYFQIVST
ncbi:unnamed protein product [Polarella glacialis]|uniref:protein xylosyltransferase n=1 Tax=Polarella glacialis TaxID=89957 RepID=A0A813K3E4_POLGL|nr:unnamed protein product [Polarella glacialis]